MAELESATMRWRGWGRGWRDTVALDMIQRQGRSRSKRRRRRRHKEGHGSDDVLPVATTATMISCVDEDV